jgi:hypothetical protein
MLKDKFRVVNFMPNDGSENVTLVGFLGSLAVSSGINQNGVVLQLDNGLLSVPLPSDINTLREQGLKYMQPLNLGAYILFKSKSYQEAKDNILNSRVSAAVIFSISQQTSSEYNNSIFYVTPYQSIENNVKQYPGIPNHISFITNLFLMNDLESEVTDNYKPYSNQDSPSKAASRYANLMNFAQTFNSEPNFNQAESFIHSAYGEPGGITMFATMNLPDATYIRFIYNYGTKTLSFNATYQPDNWINYKTVSLINN